MQPQPIDPAAGTPARHPAGRPSDDIEPGEEPGGQEQQQFNFRRWFLDNNYETGQPGIKSDYQLVGDLLGYSADYIERLVNGRRTPTKRIILACRRLDADK